jgi:hypothetical protein
MRNYSRSSLVPYKSLRNLYSRNTINSQQSFQRPASTTAAKLMNFQFNTIVLQPKKLNLINITPVRAIHHESNHNAIPFANYSQKYNNYTRRQHVQISNTKDDISRKMLIQRVKEQSKQYVMGLMKQYRAQRSLSINLKSTESLLSAINRFRYSVAQGHKMIKSKHILTHLQEMGDQLYDICIKKKESIL